MASLRALMMVLGAVPATDWKEFFNGSCHGPREGSCGGSAIGF